MTLSVITDDGLAALITLGWADVDRRIPVSTSHLFQIGSISKGFAALCLFSLAAEGKVDLASPVARYLPDAALPAEPVTVAQLLSHTSGLADGPPLFPRTPDGRLWTGFKPGSHFSYSNTGYELLGQVIASVTGRSHVEEIRRRILEPLGMAGVAGMIADRDRPRYAVGYLPFYPNRPALTGDPLAVGTWTEETTTAGSISATAEQMAAYLRYLLSLGNGGGAPVLTAASARRFITPVIAADEFGPGARYGAGLATVIVDGKPCLHHTGGMVMFASSFHADLEAGVACFASVNATRGDYRPRHTTAYAVQLLRAARARAPLPPPPDPLASAAVKDPARFVGHYVSAAEETLAIGAGPAGLVLTEGARSGRLQPAGEDDLMTDLTSRADHLIGVERNGDKISGLWWGETRFTRDASTAVAPVPERLRALAGFYLNRDPWIGGAWVLARGERLVLEGGGVLIERDGYWALEKDPGGVERFRFDGMLNGKAQRLNASGVDLYRLA